MFYIKFNEPTLPENAIKNPFLSVILASPHFEACMFVAEAFVDSVVSYWGGKSDTKAFGAYDFTLLATSVNSPEKIVRGWWWSWCLWRVRVGAAAGSLETMVALYASCCAGRLAPRGHLMGRIGFRRTSCCDDYVGILAWEVYLYVRSSEEWYILIRNGKFLNDSHGSGWDTAAFLKNK